MAIIPVSSQKDASRAISQARDHLAQRDTTDVDDTASEDMSDSDADDADADIASGPAAPSPPKLSSRPTDPAFGSGSGIAEDVIGRRVRFGRFAANWLSRKTLGFPGFGTVEQEAGADIPLGELKASTVPEIPDVDGGPDEGDDMNDIAGSGSTSGQDEGRADSSQSVELMPKLLRYTKLLFASQNFFFAYDHDLSRQVTGQEPWRNHLPLHKMVDPLVCGYLSL